MEAVAEALRGAGFEAYPAQLEDLTTRLAEPEQAGRVFFVARPAATG